MPAFLVAALYKFAPLRDLPGLKAGLEKICAENEVCGTLLLAQEGINGTIAGSRAGIDNVLGYLRAQDGLADLEHKESTAEAQPFHRMKVRIKKEIVTMGLPDIDPNKTVGEYLSPAEWDKVISDPETVVIDTRNEYEVRIGTFKNAVNPHTGSFTQFPDYVAKNLDPAKNKSVAMFCTGGIRCEKASSYMKSLGFENVYHLKGGILKYLEETPAEKSAWNGECFVFDQRVSVKHGLEQGSYALCPACREPISAADRAGEKYIEGVACPHCFDRTTPAQKASAAERHKQVKLAEARGEKHIGAAYEGDEG
ncbi:MAG TPA: rhodanese-related sulfurtransferase [Patescibacteria group bacterium]|nr:rhodanese-related sulfurtransferase [Patescibacteria group bacterium]